MTVLVLFFICFVSFSLLVFSFRCRAVPGLYSESRLQCQIMTKRFRGWACRVVISKGGDWNWNSTLLNNDCNINPTCILCFNKTAWLNPQSLPQNTSLLYDCLSVRYCLVAKKVTNAMPEQKLFRFAFASEKNPSLRSTDSHGRKRYYIISAFFMFFSCFALLFFVCVQRKKRLSDFWC